MKRTWIGLSRDNTLVSQPQCPHCRLPRRLTASCSSKWRCPERKGVKGKQLLQPLPWRGLDFFCLINTAKSISWKWLIGRVPHGDQAGVGFTSLSTAGILSMARTPLTSMSQEAESTALWPASSLSLQAAISGRAGTGQKNTPTPTPGWPEAKAPSPGD